MSGVDQGGGDDATGIGNERCVRQRVVGELDRALRAIEPRPRLVGGGLGLIHLCVRSPALGAQILGALFGGGGLRQHAGSGMQFRIGLFGLQLQVDLIEGCQRLADIDGLPDFDQAFCHLARDAEAHVGLDPRLDGAYKAALRRLGLVVHGCHQDGARWRHLFRGQLVAAGQGDRQHRQHDTC